MTTELGADATQPAAQDDAARLARAKRRVAAIKGFYIHLAVFTLVLLGLLAIDLATGRRWWVHWVFLGWGIGIVAHAIAVFGGLPQAVADWEERKIKELMRK
jgi:fatty acid desaturase